MSSGRPRFVDAIPAPTTPGGEPGHPARSARDREAGVTQPALLLRVVVVLVQLVLAFATFTDCASPAPAEDEDEVSPGRVGPLAALEVQVLATVPHDPTAFTQGFEAAGDVVLEGTGLRGHSQLRELDPTTGSVRRAVDLHTNLFGEGVTVDGETVWQLTWTDHVAFARDRRTLAVERTVPLEGEGWGICRHGEHLVTSDGSDRLTLRDRASFAPLESISVRSVGTAVEGLNELECSSEGIWANVWPTNRLVRIDPNTGLVTATVDTTGLLPPGQRADADVLNGIAAIPGTDQYWLTGKLWPTTFRVRFVPAALPGTNSQDNRERMSAVPGQATHPPRTALSAPAQAAFPVDALTARKEHGS